MRNMHKMRKLICTAATSLVLSVALASCQSEPAAPLEVSDLEINKPMPGMQMSAAYLTLTNNSDSTITITTIRSPQFAAIEMHESLLVEGVSKMRQIEKLDIAAGQTEDFVRGGKHLMLMRPTQDAFDQQTTIEFNFYSDEALLLSVNTSGSGH